MKAFSHLIRGGFWRRVGAMIRKEFLQVFRDPRMRGMLILPPLIQLLIFGYAANLERFDARLGDLLGRLRETDLLIVTADHGNDPTTPSTDHAREYVPLLVTGPQVRAGVDLGTRHTFADLGQTLAELFGVGRLTHGTSFLGEVAA